LQNPRIKHKILSVILAVCYIISSFSIQFAATPQVDIIIDSIQGNPGSTVKVPINIENIPSIGINNCDFTLKFDSDVLEFDSYESGDIVPIPIANLSVNKATDDTVKFLFNDQSQGSMPIIENGLFATITFKIKENAKTGISKLEISSYGAFSGKSGDGLQAIVPKFTSGSIEISDNSKLNVKIG